MRGKYCQAALSILFLVAGSVTGPTAWDSSGSCLYEASAAGNPSIQPDKPGIVQSASAYGRGLTNPKMRIDPLPESIPKPVPMYLLLFWIEWAYRV
jgi:hypothetical protein